MSASAGAVLILRLEAPLMAFGGPVVDHHGVTGRCPGLAQITGLLGNALGWHHRDADRLERLQDRLRFAAAVLRPGRELVDYQTVDLGQDHLVDTGWTTRGTREDRGKGEATRGTHIRYRHYRADSVVLVAVRLESPDEAPTLDDLARALDEPERPLFIGRKSCLPVAPLLAGRIDHAPGLVEALLATLADTGDVPDVVHAEWPAGEQTTVAGLTLDRQARVIDRRDWRNQVHGGERLVSVGRIRAPNTQEKAR